MRTAIIILAAVLAILMPTPSYSQDNTPGLDEILGTFNELSDDMKLTCIEMMISSPDISILPAIPMLVELLYDENPDIRDAAEQAFNIILDAADDELHDYIKRLRNIDPSQRYLAAERLGDFMSLGILALPTL